MWEQVIVIQPYLVTFNAISFKVEWYSIISTKKICLKKGNVYLKFGYLKQLLPNERLFDSRWPTKFSISSGF